jgi:hypothetical protein
MPTKPPRQLFDPDVAKSQKALIKASTALTEELRNYGLRILERCFQLSKEPHDPAILALFRHSLEMVDGFTILAAEAAIAPAVFQLRSLLEALLSLDYIVEKDTPRRANAYILVTDLIETRKALLALDPTTQQGKAYNATFARDPITANQPIPIIPDARTPRDEIDILVAEPPLNEIHDEYQRVRTASRNRSPKWYQLFDGPRNVEALAEQMGRSGLYQQIYRNASATLHAARSLRDATIRTPEKQVLMAPLRNWSQHKDAALTAFSLGFFVLEDIYKYFLPDVNDELTGWYNREAKPLGDRLRSLSLPTLPP